MKKKCAKLSLNTGLTQRNFMKSLKVANFDEEDYFAWWSAIHAHESIKARLENPTGAPKPVQTIDEYYYFPIFCNNMAV